MRTVIFRFLTFDDLNVARLEIKTGSIHCYSCQILFFFYLRFFCTRYSSY